MGRAFEFRKARKLKRWSKMAKTFTRIGKDISMAVKEGGPNPDTNSRLRQIIQNARSANMPKDNIERAIKKASEKDATNYIEISLEGYSAFGVAIFVDCTTDNNNRTVANVRSYFNKFEGRLGTNGSLEFIFDKKGVFYINKNNIPLPLDQFEMQLIDAGLEEMQVEGDSIIVFVEFGNFNEMSNFLESIKIDIETAEVQRIPNNFKSVDIDQAELVLKLIDKLEEDEDVQSVYHNMLMTNEIIALIEKNR